ncbi:MAG: hypothetical protein NE334_21670 [Lentisphaeraceae bacterium]|nr:hypothetical protein [Lentisphaeraceae bacterium]
MSHIPADQDSGNNVHGTHKTGLAGENGYWSYGLNTWTWSADIDDLRTSDPYFRSFAEAGNASNTPLFFVSSWINAQPRETKLLKRSMVVVDGSGSNNSKRIYLDRHYQKKVNYTMIDGSAKTIKINKLYHLDWNQNFLYKDLPLF